MDTHVSNRRLGTSVFGVWSWTETCRRSCYACVLKALTPFAWPQLHLKPSVFKCFISHICPPLAETPYYFQFDSDLEFSLDIFSSVFIQSLHHSTGGPLDMVFEHLWDLFDLQDSTNGFPQLFQVYSPVDMGHISKSIALVFDIAKLLASAKPFQNIWLIIAGEILYQLVNRALCLQFHDFFHSLVTTSIRPSIWRGNWGVWGCGSWHLNYSKHPSLLCGIGGCQKHLQHHL